MDAEDEDEFRGFYVACWERLLRLAVLLTDDHGRAEDLVQNAMMRVHRHWHRVQRANQPEAYARRILVNQFYSMWRRRLPELPREAVPDTVAADEFGAVDLREYLWPAVTALPPRMRAVLVLRYYEDLTERETAEILGCSVGAVKSHASRALRRMRAGLPPGHAVDRSAGTEPPPYVLAPGSTRGQRRPA